jgi:hypothetical protein
MADYGVSLGDLANALRISGGDPSIVDIGDDEEPTQGIQDTPFNPRASSAQMQREFAAGQNQGLDLAQRGGEIQSEAAMKNAEAAGVLRDRREAGYQRAMGAQEQLGSDEDRYRAMADRHLAEVSRQVKAPPEKRGEILQIIGAMLAATGSRGGNALGTGLSMLGQRMDATVAEWGQKIAANQTAFGMALKAAASARDGAQTRVKLEQGLADLAYGVYASAIEEAKQEATSAEAVQAADVLQLKLRQGYLADTLKIRQRAQQGVAASKRQQERDALINMPLPELAQLVRAGYGGELANDVYLERAKEDQGIRKTEAEIAAIERSGRESAGPQVGSAVVGGYEVANPQVWSSLGEGTRSDFAKGVAAVPGLIRDLTELKAMIKRHGTETLPGETKSRMQALSAAALGGIKEAASLGALDNGVAALVSKQIGDPTAWNFGLGNAIEQADTRIGETIKSIQQNAQAKAAAYGLRPAIPAGNTVRIKTPDGRTMEISRARLAEAMKLGAVLDSPLTGL